MRECKECARTLLTLSHKKARLRAESVEETTCEKPRMRFNYT